jgi:large subunit ribosomal protein L28
VEATGNQAWVDGAARWRVDHNGSLDAFLLKAKADLLSPRALDLKRAIEKKKAADPVATAS